MMSNIFGKYSSMGMTSISFIQPIVPIINGYENTAE